MIKQNKAKILLSSAVILLPAVYGIIMWNHLPDTMATHWGADGITDGTAGKALAVFGLPLLYLLVHLFCLWLTLRDQEKRSAITCRSSEETGRLASRFRGRLETRKTGTGRTALPERSGSAEDCSFSFPCFSRFWRWPG